VKKEESALFPELSIFTGRSSIVVTVRVEIDAQGKVTSAKAVGTLPVSRELAPNLYDLAEETAKKWEFFPATGTTDANGVTEKLASKKTIRVKLFMVNTN
ncbi:MAG TPA: hypothetical protein VJX74_01495, partial [Blastocatellia bacterium]|nr:hypothetical protein [Blastocatellia bacterium]